MTEPTNTGATSPDAESGGGGSLETHVGRIVHANNYGLFVAVDQKTALEHAFTLDMVKNYDGRDPRQYGIAEGREVSLTIDHGRVVGVAPVAIKVM